MLQLIFSVEDKKREYARKATQRRVGQLDGIFGIKHPELVKATSSRGVAVRMVVVGTVESESIWSTCHGFSSWTITHFVSGGFLQFSSIVCFSMPKMFNSSCSGLLFGPCQEHIAESPTSRRTSREIRGAWLIRPPKESHDRLPFQSSQTLHSFTHFFVAF